TSDKTATTEPSRTSTARAAPTTAATSPSASRAASSSASGAARVSAAIATPTDTTGRRAALRGPLRNVGAHAPDGAWHALSAGKWGRGGAIILARRASGQENGPPTRAGDGGRGGDAAPACAGAAPIAGSIALGVTADRAVVAAAGPVLVQQRRLLTAGAAFAIAARRRRAAIARAVARIAVAGIRPAGIGIIGPLAGGKRQQAGGDDQHSRNHAPLHSRSTFHRSTGGAAVRRDKPL